MRPTRGGLMVESETATEVESDDPARRLRQRAPARGAERGGPRAHPGVRAARPDPPDSRGELVRPGRDRPAYGVRTRPRPGAAALPLRAAAGLVLRRRLPRTVRRAV